jgi:hypothetical protein
MLCQWNVYEHLGDLMICGLHCKKVIYGHMPVKSHFSVIIIQFTAKCP